MKAPDLETNARAATELLAVMANETRLMILCQLLSGEKSVGELADALESRPSTISQHLALLRTRRLVDTRRQAQKQIYSLAGREARTILSTLQRLYCPPAAKPPRRRSNA